MNKTRFQRDGRVDGLELFGYSFLQCSVEAAVAVGEKVISGIDSFSHVEIVKKLAGFRCNVMAFKSFGDVGTLKT